MGVWWTLFVFTLHTVWSISRPHRDHRIARARSPDEPLPRLAGLAITSVLYVLGSGLVFLGTYRQEQFMATPAQLLGVVVGAVALTMAAFTLRQPIARSDRAVPDPWPVGVFSLLTASSFLVSRSVLADWPLVFAYLLLYGLVAVMVVRWSGRAGWAAAHRPACWPAGLS